MNATKKILFTAAALTAIVVLLFSQTSAPVPPSPAPADVPVVESPVLADPDADASADRESPPLHDLRILGALLLAQS